jgi:hypothetical protein
MPGRRLHFRLHHIPDSKNPTTMDRVQAMSKNLAHFPSSIDELDWPKPRIPSRTRNPHPGAHRTCETEPRGISSAFHQRSKPATYLLNGRVPVPVGHLERARRRRGGGGHAAVVGDAERLVAPHGGPAPRRVILRQLYLQRRKPAAQMCETLNCRE